MVDRPPPAGWTHRPPASDRHASISLNRILQGDNYPHVIRCKKQGAWDVIRGKGYVIRPGSVGDPDVVQTSLCTVLGPAWTLFFLCCNTVLSSVCHALVISGCLWCSAQRALAGSLAEPVAASMDEVRPRGVSTGEGVVDESQADPGPV